MNKLKKILYFLSLFNRLGKKQYSIFFPLFITGITAIFLEIYTQQILHDPTLADAPAVIIFLGLVIYFSFHDGIRGGITASVVTIIYYFYITFTRGYPHNIFIRNIETSMALGLLYLSLAAVIGGLKQKTDILLERESDEKTRLQTILEQMPAGVIVTNKNGKVSHVNKAFEEIVGNKIPIGAVVEHDKEVAPKTYQSNFSHNVIIQLLKGEKTIMKKETAIKRKDGKEKYLQISASPIFGKNNKVTAVVGIIIDITQQKEQEKRKDDFVNIASHELRTPITSMKLYLNSLSSRLINKDNQTQKIVKNLHYQTARLQELVNDLLDVSRLQTGKMIFTKESFLLNDFLKESIADLRVFAKKHQIIFIEKNNVVVSADKFRIAQVITNIITNAIKYSDPSTDIIVRVDKEKSNAVVSVKDFGIGISKEEQKKIFDRLYQVNDGKGKTFPGLGIGLYISKQIIKRHRGSIWVKSEKGKGATFYFSLPLLRKNSNYDKKYN